MLEHLKLQNLGPSRLLEFEFAPRLNILTGDNGLGKTFALDLAWWALTRTWADGRVIHPTPDRKGDASIAYHVYGKSGPNTPVTCTYRREDLDWSLPQRRPPSPGFVLYARIDGGFSLWDPARNYWHEKNPDINASDQRPDSFQFGKRQLWEGLRDDSGKIVCRGLLEDWETWRLKGNGAFELLTAVLADLSPSDAPLRPGDSIRLPDSGARDIPTLVFPYGIVPITQASAGVRRILSLAYMIVWAWTEHRIAAQLKQHEQANRIVLLWDEVEAHLHPQWQRSILPAVLGVLQKRLLIEHGTQLQGIVTTHAPLVLASLETTFNVQQDRLFNLELINGNVHLETVHWAKHGDVTEWLRSPAFDLRSGYSRDAEKALFLAQAFLANRRDQLSEPFQTFEQIDAELRRTLADDDPFWPRWILAKGDV